MVKKCSAVGCHNAYTKGSGIHFYRFPTDPERRSKWIAAVSRENWQPNEHSWLCSEHFVSGEKSNNPLAPNYIPTLFSHVQSPVKLKMVAQLEDFNRRQAMKRRRIENEPSLTVDEVEQTQSAVTTTPSSREVHVQLLCNAHSQLGVGSQLGMLKQQHDALQKQIEELQKQEEVLRAAYNDLKSNACFRPENMKDDDKKVKYYTGLPSYSILNALYEYLTEDLKLPNIIMSAKKSVFEQFVLVLMKLRLNLGDQDLAYRFQITQSTVSRYCNRWMDVLYTSLSCLVTWPEREELMKTMPIEFRKHFRKCVIIIDCFEVFIERPTSQTARSQTWSNYKHHNTIKYLIGITPQGSVAFISQGWGGRTSDVHLTENSGLLQKLLPGDLILADRGFTIEDTVGLYCAEVNIPPFTKGKRQLSKVEVDAARRLSRVRIHVERVIGSIRQKYTMLQSTIPINMLMCDEGETVSYIDKVVMVCCALCNCSNSIVPTD